MTRTIGLACALTASCAVALVSPAQAQMLSLFEPSHSTASLFSPNLREAPPGAETPNVAPDQPANLRRQIVAYQTREAAGTIIIDTGNTYLYYVLGNNRAIRYGIGVGRDGFTWSGIQHVSRMAEWPDWIPPSEMIGRQPYLPRFMAGGPTNPLGARALYLGNTIYRIHGTNAPDTIGQRVSSGCIRMVNDDVADLYGRVKLGTKVVVLPGGPRHAADASRASQQHVAVTHTATRGTASAFQLY